MRSSQWDPSCQASGGCPYWITWADVLQASSLALSCLGSELYGGAVRTLYKPDRDAADLEEL